MHANIYANANNVSGDSGGVVDVDDDDNDAVKLREVGGTSMASVKTKVFHSFSNKTPVESFVFRRFWNRALVEPLVFLLLLAGSGSG